MIFVSSNWTENSIGLKLVNATPNNKYAGFQKKCLIKISFLISQPKHMFWVLERTDSMGWFFRAHKTDA